MNTEQRWRVQLKHKQSFENLLSFHLKIAFCMMFIANCSEKILRSKEKIISAAPLK